MAGRFRYLSVLFLLQVAVMYGWKSKNPFDYNFLAYKFNTTVIQESFKYAKHLDLNQFIKKELPMSFSHDGVNITIEKAELNDIEGEHFNIEFPGQNNFRFQAGFEKLQFKALVHFSMFSEPIWVTVGRSHLDTEFGIEYIDGEAGLKLQNCDLSIGAVNADDDPFVSTIEKILFQFLDKKACNLLEKYVQHNARHLRARAHMTLLKGVLDEEYYMKATKITIDKDYFTVIESVYEVKGSGSGSGKDIHYSEPFSQVPNFPEKDHALFIVLGQGVFTPMVEKHAKHMYGKASNIMHKYSKMYYLYHYINETQRIFPDAKLIVKPLSYKFVTEITPEWIVIKTNMSLEFIANVTCSGRQTNHSMMIWDMDLQIPIQIYFNDSLIKLNLATIRGNITARNSTVGPVDGIELRRDLNLLPKIFYSTLFYGINKNISPIPTKPLTHLPGDLYVTDVNVTLLEGMLVLEESVLFEANHKPVTNQPWNIVGGKHSIYDAAIEVQNDPSNYIREKDKPHTCHTSSAISAYPTILFLCLCVVMARYLKQ